VITDQRNSMVKLMQTVEGGECEGSL
jgi:hypothetical protein